MAGVAVVITTACVKFAWATERERHRDSVCVCVTGRESRAVCDMYMGVCVYIEAFHQFP